MVLTCVKGNTHLKVLSDVGMLVCKLTKTPMDQNFNLSKYEGKE